MKRDVSPDMLIRNKWHAIRDTNAAIVTMRYLLVAANISHLRIFKQFNALQISSFESSRKKFGGKVTF